MLHWFVNYKRWETLEGVPYRLLVLLIPGNREGRPNNKQIRLNVLQNYI
jgi:hypothetical protein